MALPPRGMQRLNRLGLSGGSSGLSAVPGKSEDRASDFLDKMHQRRANKLASGRVDTVSKGQQRRAEMTQFRNTGTAAKSMAHQGAVIRPMDQNLSKILQNRREELKSRGTSVARIRRHEQFEETEEEGLEKKPELVRPEDITEQALQEANSLQGSTEQGTGVGHLRTAKKEMKLTDNRAAKSLGSEPSELMI